MSLGGAWGDLGSTRNTPPLILVKNPLKVEKEGRSKTRHTCGGIGKKRVTAFDGSKLAWREVKERWPICLLRARKSRCHQIKRQKKNCR